MSFVLSSKTNVLGIPMTVGQRHETLNDSDLKFVEDEEDDDN